MGSDNNSGMLIQSRYALLTLIRCICRYSHIPLCLLYSSLSKFFLLFLLSVWGHPKSPAQGLPPPRYEHTIRVENPALRRVWEALDDDKLDREWVVRNVLGGMAAGFGLRGVSFHFRRASSFYLTRFDSGSGLSSVFYDDCHTFRVGHQDGRCECCRRLGWRQAD